MDMIEDLIGDYMDRICVLCMKPIDIDGDNWKEISVEGFSGVIHMDCPEDVPEEIL